LFVLLTILFTFFVFWAAGGGRGGDDGGCGGDDGGRGGDDGGCGGGGCCCVRERKLVVLLREVEIRNRRKT
jgi:hypothetical protein